MASHVVRVEQRRVDGKVGRRARVGLHVDAPLRVVEVERRERALLAEQLDLVDDLVAAIVPRARLALAVLVRERRAERLEDGRGREILGRDELDACPARQGARGVAAPPRRGMRARCAATSTAASATRRSAGHKLSGCSCRMSPLAWLVKGCEGVGVAAAARGPARSKPDRKQQGFGALRSMRCIRHVTCAPLALLLRLNEIVDLAIGLGERLQRLREHGVHAALQRARGEHASVNLVRNTSARLERPRVRGGAAWAAWGVGGGSGARRPGPQHRVGDK